MKIEAQPRVAGTVIVPSRGKFYGDICPNGEIEIYPMTGRDEALVAGMGDEPLSDVFDSILQRCLKTPISPDELLGTDKLFLMLTLRANSYGSYYDFPVQCPNCKFISRKACNIPSDFKLTEYKAETGEPFSVTLPVSKYRIGFKLLRSKDEKAVTAYKKRSLEALEDPTPARVRNTNAAVHTYRLAKHITTINDEVPEIQDSISLLDSISTRDTSAFRDAIEVVSSGVNTELTVKCPNCEHEFRSGMVFSAEFFRAQSRGSKES